MSTNLEDISSQVKLWRSQKRFPQEKMSSELRERIYSLREHMSDSEIIRSLELSYSFFTTRKSAPKKKSKSPPLGSNQFVKYTPSTPKSPNLVIELRSGISLKIFE